MLQGMNRYLFFLLFLLSTKAYAEDMVAVVNLKFIKNTGSTASVICYGENSTDCSSWASYYLYEAKVKKVLSGKFPSKKIKVIYGRHALLEKNFKNWVVSLDSVNEREKEETGGEYKIIEVGEYRNMYCFSGKYLSLIHI